MRNTVYILFLCLILVSRPEAKTESDSSSFLPTVAVLDLEGNGISQTEVRGFTERLRAELFNTGRFDILERDQMASILKEMEFQMSGCTSDECAVEVGRLVGVEKMVAGSINKIGQIFSITIRLINVETGRIEKIVTKDIQGDVSAILTVGIPAVANQLAGLESPDIQVSYSIITDPPRAKIFLNGDYQGKSPKTLQLSPGEKYEIRVEKNGFKTFEKNVVPVPGQSESMNILLPIEEKEKSPVKYRFVNGFKIRLISSQLQDEVSSQVVKPINNLIRNHNYFLFREMVPPNLVFSDVKNFNGFEIINTRQSGDVVHVSFGLGAFRNDMDIWMKNSFSNSISGKVYTLSIWMPSVSLQVNLSPIRHPMIYPYFGAGVSYNMLFVNAYKNGNSIGGPSFQNWGLNLNAGIEVFLSSSFSLDLGWQQKVLKMELMRGLNNINDRFEEHGLNEADLSGSFISLGLHFHY